MPQTAFLKNRFGLTPAEARLVLRLMSGDSLRSAAKALGIEYETVRTTSSQFSRKPERAGRPSWSSLLFMPSAICPDQEGRSVVFRPKLNPLGPPSRLLGEIEPAAARHHGSVQQEVRDCVRTPPNWGVASWNLPGLMSSSCSAGAAHSRTGARAPPFSRKGKDTSLVTPPRETTRRSPADARDNGDRHPRVGAAVWHDKIGARSKCTSGVGRRRHDAVW